MANDYQECIDLLERGKNNDALDIFANATIDDKLNIIFTLLTEKREWLRTRD